MTTKRHFSLGLFLALLLAGFYIQAQTDVQGAVYAGYLYLPDGGPETGPDDAGNPVLVGAYGYTKNIYEDGGSDFSSGFIFTPLTTDFQGNLFVYDPSTSQYATPSYDGIHEGQPFTAYNQCICAPTGTQMFDTTSVSTGLSGVGVFLRDLSTSPAADMSVTAYLAFDGNEGGIVSDCSANFGSNSRSAQTLHFSATTGADLGTTITTANIVANNYPGFGANNFQGFIQNPGGAGQVCVAVSSYTAGSLYANLFTTVDPTPMSSLAIPDSAGCAGGVCNGAMITSPVTAAPPFANLVMGLDDGTPTTTRSMRMEPGTNNLKVSLWNGSNEASFTGSILNTSVSGSTGMNAVVSVAPAYKATLFSSTSTTGPSTVLTMATPGSASLAQAITDHRLIFTTTGSPTGVSVDLETSPDNTNWTIRAENVANSTKGEIAFSGYYPYVRANLLTLSGGSSPTLTGTYVGTSGTITFTGVRSTSQDIPPTQATLSTTASKVVTATPGICQALVVNEDTAISIRCGETSAVTSTLGIPIQPGSGYHEGPAYSGDVYCASSSGTPKIDIQLTACAQ